jgi:hypothetical protein
MLRPRPRITDDDFRSAFPYTREELMTTPAGLELRLTTRQTTYRLDLAGITPQEYRHRLAELQRQLDAGAFLPADELPQPPAVDLAVEIHNRGPGEAVVWLGGDDSWLTLELAGPKPFTLRHGGPFTADLRWSEPVRLAPGAGQVVPLGQLCHGPRGCDFTYWTEPGEYTLTAHYQLGSHREPPDDPATGPPGPVLSSAPLRLTVRT